MIFLISEPNHIAIAREKLSCGGLYKIATGTFKRLLSDFSNSKELKIIGYDCEAINEQKKSEIQDLSQQFPGVKILVFTNQIVIAVYQALYQIKNITVLSRESSLEKIQAIVQKIVTTGDLEKIADRFTMDQPVHIVVLRTGQVMQSTIRDYSATGAFLEYRGISIEVGDVLQIGILEKVDSKYKQSHQIKAEVTDIKVKQFEKLTKGLGVRFL